MPLIQIGEVKGIDLDAQSPLRGCYLDQPRRGALVDGSVIDSWGWVIGRDHQAVSVEFIHDGRLLRRVPVNVPRPDLRGSFPQVAASEHRGFRTEIPIVGRYGEFRIDVRCVLSDGARVSMAMILAQRRWRSAYDPSIDPRLVSVVIPCFNHAQYLGEAIASVRAQTYPHIELVVIDDGSSDNLHEVANRLGVRVVTQDHQGLAAARNVGLRRTNGMYLVFLDADDRLASGAIEAALRALDAHPEAAFTSGRCRWIATDGTPLPTPEHGCPRGDLFANLLRANYTGMPATVMYRRGVFEVVHGFDVSGEFLGVEDYELVLRIARQFPVCCHEAVVAEYRVRPESMSRNPARMLEGALRAVRAQRAHLGRSTEHRTAYDEGLRFWQQYYGRPLVRQLEGDVQRRQWRRAMEGAWTLARCYRRGLVSIVRPHAHQMNDQDH
jgi:glycosyltransferase involved in cell wall biosynthesis